MVRERNGAHESSQGLDRLRPEVVTGIAYLKEMRQELLKNWNPRKTKYPPFGDMEFVFDAMDCLNPDLSAKMSGKSLLDAIAPFATHVSKPKEKQDLKFSIGDLITNLTIRAKKAYEKLPLYWLRGLFSHPNNSESYAGLVFDLSVPIDKPTTTNGGEELSQAILAIRLHDAFMTTKTGKMQFVEELGVGPIDRRTAIGNSQTFLKIVSEGKYAKIPHLQHILEPITSKNDVYTHNSALRDVKGKPAIHMVDNPEKEVVRLIRSNPDGSKGYFLDLNAEYVQTMDPKVLGDILTSTDPRAYEQELKKKWTSFEDGYSLYGLDTDPPLISISSGAFEKELTEASKAASIGVSPVHIAFDHGKINLKWSHIPQNGAPAKPGAFTVAYAVQHEREGSDPLQPDKSPLTEIRPPYHDSEMPSQDDLDDLVNTLSRARRHKKDFSKVKYDETLQKMIGFVALENVGTKFSELGPDKTKYLSDVADYLNRKYTQPRADLFAKFCSEHPSVVNKLDDKSLAILTDIVAPPITMQDLFAIGFAFFDGNSAVNRGPLDPTVELTHSGVPKIVDRDGRLLIDDPMWLSLYNTDKGLAKFGANIYNVYKLLTASWRKNTVGAESLGEITSRPLKEFMEVETHISELGSWLYRYKGKLLELSDFTTAKPDPDETAANAFSWLITKKEDGIHIRPKFRDNLTETMLEKLPIDASPEFMNTISLVKHELTKNAQPAEKQKLDDCLNRYYGSWLKHAKSSGHVVSRQDKRPGNSLVLAKVMGEISSELRGQDAKIARRAIQVLLAAGIRAYRADLMRKVLYLKIA